MRIQAGASFLARVGGYQLLREQAGSFGRTAGFARTIPLIQNIEKANEEKRKESLLEDN
jgi:hypothetical protein